MSNGDGNYGLLRLTHSVLQVLQLQHPLSAGAAGSGAGHADILAEHPFGAEDSEGSDWQELINDVRALHSFVGAAGESAGKQESDQQLQPERKRCGR